MRPLAEDFSASPRRKKNLIYVEKSESEKEIKSIFRRRKGPKLKNSRAESNPISERKMEAERKETQPTTGSAMNGWLENFFHPPPDSNGFRVFQSPAGLGNKISFSFIK